MGIAQILITTVILINIKTDDGNMEVLMIIIIAIVITIIISISISIPFLIIMFIIKYNDAYAAASLEAAQGRHRVGSAALRVRLSDRSPRPGEAARGNVRRRGRRREGLALALPNTIGTAGTHGRPGGAPAPSQEDSARAPPGIRRCLVTNDSVLSVAAK